MINYNEWLVEQEGGTTLEGCKLMLNGTKLMVECECGSFDLELDEEQAADLTEKMNACGNADGGDDLDGDEGMGDEGMEGDEGMGDEAPAMPPGRGAFGGGMAESKITTFAKCCPKCKKKKCSCKLSKKPAKKPLKKCGVMKKR